MARQFLLYTSNYTAFASAALTNDPATLSNLFPGLVITSSQYYYVVIATPNVVAYYTNNFVLGNPPVLVVTTNGYTYTPVLNYADTFANLVIITNSYHTNTSAQLVTVQVSQGGVLGNPLVTNTTIKSITLTNVPSGDYYINTNYLCGPTDSFYQFTITDQCDGDDQPYFCHQQLGGLFHFPKHRDLFHQPCLCRAAAHLLHRHGCWAV